MCIVGDDVKLVNSYQYFAVCELEAARLDKSGLWDSLITSGPAADVDAGGVQAEAGTLQGGKHGVSLGCMVGVWVVILDRIHPALK